MPDSAIIEPIFLLRASPEPPKHGGRYQLVGLDSAGELLFSARLESVSVADLTQHEQHFEVRIPTFEEAAGRLHRVELRVGDRLLAQRTSRFTAAEFSQEVEAHDVVAAVRLGRDRVRLIWDADRFPMVMVSDPSTGEILSFGRAGEVTVRTGENTLEVALSDGVRSRMKTVQVR